ncbi:hypothetical protein [Promicromonospora sp. NPDC023805]|uniref:hypothetical protein n=1 Tax=Promicromonospora sp. NPDC023805 TaxID=3154696 RepID=UPI00340694C3
MKDPTPTDPEPIPTTTEATPALRRAAEALHTAWTDLPHEVHGHAAAEALAAAALAAAFDSAEIALQLCEYTGRAAYQGPIPCEEHSLAVAVVRDVMLGGHQGVVAHRDEIIGGDSADNLTIDPRATPIGRAVSALEDRIRRSIGIELRPAQLPGMTGQLFGATMPELARDAVSAALDVEELARAIDPRAFEPKTRRSSFAHYVGAQRAALQKAAAVRTMVLGAGQ